MVFRRVDRSRRIRQWLLSGCAAAVLLGGITPVAADEAVPPAAASEQKRHFAVSRQPLHSALNEWSMTSGRDWGHIGDGFGDAETPGVQGEFTDDEALARLLAGTGFTFNVVATGDVSIVKIQTEPAPNTALVDPAVNNDESIDTIIVRSVTAQRREEDVQDVPVAVSAFNSRMLSQRQMSSTGDLGRNVINLLGGNNVGLGTSIAYFMRGVGSTESIATFDLPVGTYVDEVYISRQNSNQITLSGAQRIEVLRGPQGTLFGRNTTGGAVSIITEKPGDEFGAGLEVGYGSYDRITASGHVNVPLTDGLYSRLSAFVVNEDGYMENEPSDPAFRDEKFNGEKSWGVRGALRLQPSDLLTWDASLQYIESDYLQIGTPGVIGTSIPVTGDLYKVRLNERECEPTGDPATWPGQGCHFNSAESLLVISNITFNFNAGTLNLITGWFDLDHTLNIDVLGNTDQPLFGGGLGANFYISNVGRHNQVSQEVKWTGSLLDGRISYVSGFYFMQENNDTRFIDTVFPPFVPPGTPFVLADRTPLSNDTRSIALFTQADFWLTDQFVLQAGVRWTEEDKDLSVQGTITDDDLDAEGIPRHQNASRWTPRAAVSYHFRDDVMAYFSFTQGFKSGGWNARTSAAVNMQPFGPETVDSWELGLRSEWYDGRVLANLTLFRAIYDDFQLPTAFGQDFLTLNSGKAQVDGLEAELAYRVTDTLDLFGSLGLMDAEYLELSPGAIAVDVDPGVKLAHTPKVTAIVGFIKNFPLAGDHLLQLTANMKYTDEYETLAANLPEGHVDESFLFNAQVSWTLPDESWQLIAECKNCTGVERIRQTLFNTLYPSDPRRWGVRVRYRY